MFKFFRNFILRKILKKELITLDVFAYAKFAYSQEGEDLLLNRLLNKKRKGVYVDIGAHHPTKISNTYFFYKKGWNGINIDAMPGSMNEFNRIRPNDFNIEAAISNSDQVLEFYEFNAPEFNTFSKEIMEKNLKRDSIKLIKKHSIQTQKLSKVLDEVSNKIDLLTIDFMSIDVEGLDLEVLKSNNWEKYYPNFILAELHNQKISDLNTNEINNFLVSKGYELICKTYNTWFFKSCTFELEL